MTIELNRAGILLPQTAFRPITHRPLVRFRGEYDTLAASTLPQLTYKRVKNFTHPSWGTIEQYRFSNGFQLYTCPDKRVPLASFGVVVKTGTADEPRSVNGVSHFLEHLFFKGTRLIKPKEYDRRLEILGASSNAWTNYDETVYHFTDCPNGSFLEAIPLLGESLANLLIPQGELDTERHVVIEEIGMYDDKLSTAVGRIVQQQVWPESKYHWDVLGPKRVIETISRDEILKYYAKNYAPTRQVGIALGDFDTPQLLNTIAQTFNHPFPPKGDGRPELKASAKRSPHVKLRPLEVSPETLLSDDIDVAQLLQVYDGPRTSKSDRKTMLTLELFDLILGTGDDSRLYQALVEKEKLASDVHSVFDVLKHRSLFAVKAECSPAKLPKVKRRINEIVADIVQNGVTDIELTRARKKWHWDNLRATQRQDNRLEIFAKMIARGFKPNKVLQEDEAVVASITSRDIQLFAQQYLKPENGRLITVLPDSYAKANKLDAKPAKPHAQAKPKFAGSLRADEQSIRLKQGSELIVKPDPNAAITSISIRLPGLGSQREKVTGTTSWLEELLERGPRGMSVLDFEGYLKDHQIDIYFSPPEGVLEPDALNIKLCGPSDSVPQMFDIVTQVLSRPKLLATDLKQVQRVSLEDIKQMSKTEFDDVVRYAALQALYPGTHPYGQTPFQVAEHAAQVTPSVLKAFYQQGLDPKSFTIAVSGRVSVEDMTQSANTLIEVVCPKKSVPSVKPSTIPATTLAENRLIFEPRPSMGNQLLMRRLWKAPGYGDDPKDLAAMRMLTQVMDAGMSARLFQTFRERADLSSEERAEALCYSVYAVHKPREVGGEFTFYIGTTPEKWPLADSLFQAEVDKLLTTLPSQEEMTRGINQLRSSLYSKLQAQEDISDDLARHRASGSPSAEDIIEACEKVTPEDVQRLAQKYLTQPSLTAIVGNPDQLKGIIPDDVLSPQK